MSVPDGAGLAVLSSHISQLFLSGLEVGLRFWVLRTHSSWCWFLLPGSSGSPVEHFASSAVAASLQERRTPAVLQLLMLKENPEELLLVLRPGKMKLNPCF